MKILPVTLFRKLVLPVTLKVVPKTGYNMFNVNEM
jgi:hypothetical protein